MIAPRSPYVILGIPYGSDASTARAGFAKGSRRLRQDSDAPYTMEDLTWALHQVEQAVENPDLAFEHYRVPATSIPPPAGLFNPDPERLAPQHPPPNDTDRSQLLDEVLRSRLQEALTQDLRPTIPYEE